MKALKNIIIVLLINYTVLSCAQEKKDRNNNQDLINTKSENKNMKNIEKILIDQIESGAAEEYSSFEHYSEKDLNVLIIFEDSILKSNGFKILETKQFNDKVKKIFNRIIDNSSQNEYLKIDTYKDNTCDKKLVYYPHSAEFQNIYISKTNRFLTYFHPLPQIIDYKKLYPQLSRYEEKPFTIETMEGKIDITRWKDITDLDQHRKRNIQTLVARNMYLFNDNRAYFRWLVLNDEYFMRSLVTTFGYYDDKELNKWVVDKTKFNADFEELDKIFWNKKCDGTVKLNTTIYPVLQEIITPENANNYFEPLKNYVMYLLSDENQTLSTKDKANLLAHLVYFGEQYRYDKKYEDKSYFMQRIVFYDLSGDIEKEIEKNNYYNLSEYKNLYIKSKEYEEELINENGG